MAGRIVSPDFVGRASDLEVLERALAEAAEGRARTVLIGGEAGIGKSRLLAEALDGARGRAALVLVGGCVGLAEGSLPFAPIIEAVRPLMRQNEGALAEPGAAGTDIAWSDEARAALRAVVADLGLRGAIQDDPTEVAELRPEWVRSRLYEAVLDLLRRLGEASPVVLAVEDLHWADTATRELLAFLVRNARAERLLLIATFRSDELHRRHPLLPWLAEVDRTPAVERIELARLDRAAVARQLAGILGQAPEPNLLATVYDRSDGNPFFAEELLAAGAGGSRLPPTLREVLAARLANLSDPAHRLLGVAAIAGRRVDHDLLVDVAGMSEETLFDALRETTAAQLLLTDVDPNTEAYAFRHALIAEAAAESVLPGERRQLHATIAEALERRGGLAGAERAVRLAEIAHHWIEAREVDRGFDAALAAAEAAFESHAYAEALRQYERAIETWDLVADPAGRSRGDRVELFRRGARAAQLAGDSDRAGALIRDAIAQLDLAGDPYRVGILYERLGRALWTGGRIEDSVAAYSRAAEIVPPEPPSEQRARVLAGYGQILMLAGRYRESLVVADEARAMAALIGSPAIEGHATTTVATDVGLLGRLSEGIGLARRGLEISLEANDHDDIGRSHANLSTLLELAGQVEESIEVSLDGAAWLRQAGLGATYGSFNSLNAAGSLYRLGRWDEALALTIEAECVAVGVSRIFAEQTLARLRVGRGEFDEARDALSEMARLLGRGIDAQFNGPSGIARLELAAWTDDTDAGRSATDEVLRILDATEELAITAEVLAAALRIEADAAERARAARSPADERASVERAGLLLDRLRSLMSDAPSAEFGATLEHWVKLGEAEAARATNRASADLWAAAAASFDRQDFPYPAAYSRYRGAEAALAGKADRADVLPALRDAFETARRLGAAPLREAIARLATRARIDLAGSGAAPDAAEPDAPDGLAAYDLTARELEVLRLVALGRTNRQIADELFISESTAGVHVSHILGKLGVAGRVEAATIAARLGLA